MPKSFNHELTDGDKFTFKQAGERINASWPPDVEGRYSFYRRHGHSKADSMAYAITWAKNTAEQAVRRRRSA